MKTCRWTPFALALSPFLFACSGASETGPGKSSATSGCDPNAEIPCIAGIAEPCKNFHTNYDGDEYCLAPPDPAKGYQLHVGPTDYTNPDEVSKYIAHPGDETNWAEVHQTPNDTEVWTSGYYSHMRPGSHHFILFGLAPGSMTPTTSGPTMNGNGAESAVGALGGQFLAGATRQIQNAVANSNYPEDQGIARDTPAHQQVAMNLHFINTKEHDLLQELWVNFFVIPADQVKLRQAAITWYGGYAMNIPPGTQYTLTNSNSSGCAPPKGVPNVRILGMTGHVHANTLQYNATMQRDGQSTLLFQDYDWHDPTEFRFNRAVENGTPDASSKKAGGYSGVLDVQDTDRFFWECDGFNKSNVNLTFSNKVYDGEMCNVFGFYATDAQNPAPWTCIFL